jgi:hypothetical protein
VVQAGTHVVPLAMGVAQLPMLPNAGATAVQSSGLHVADVKTPRVQVDLAPGGSSP